jgi:hypothetical protein
LATPVQREELRGRHTQSTRSSHSLDNRERCALGTSGRRRLRRGSDYDLALTRPGLYNSDRNKGKLDSYLIADLTSLILDSYSVLDRILDSSTQLPVLDRPLDRNLNSGRPPLTPQSPRAPGAHQRVKLDNKNNTQIDRPRPRSRRTWPARQTTRSASDTTYEV